MDVRRNARPSPLTDGHFQDEVIGPPPECDRPTEEEDDLDTESPAELDAPAPRVDLDAPHGLRATREAGQGPCAQSTLAGARVPFGMIPGGRELIC